MPASDITLSDLKPFLAPLLMEAAGRQRDAALLKKVMGEVSKHARRTSSRRRRILRTADAEASDGMFLQAVIYREAGSPAWLNGGKLENVEHQLVVVAVKGKYVAICASDASMRERIAKNAKAIRRVPRTIIAKFVGPDTRSIWLNGVHTPTATKPDTKALTGVSLEHAIDPIGDQSFFYSAVRSAPRVAGLEDDQTRPMTVGAAPAGGRVWVNRAQNWPDFKTRMAAIFNHAASRAAPVDPFAALSRPVETPVGVVDAYAVSVVPPELLSEDDIPSENLEAARRWAYDANYEVEALAGLSLRVKPRLLGAPLGELELAVTLADGIADIQPRWISRVPGKEAECDQCTLYLGDPDRVKIYYDSGHTIAQGRCYEGGYSDQPFDWAFHDFAGYEITKEKPPVPAGSSLAAQIATGGDNSLFAYVCEKLFLDDAGNRKGWLASDDGSMELADFIHIDPDTKTVTLVHVKASSRDDDDREAAPSEYEVVVSQAVKNLRHLDRRKLSDELERGKAKKIGAAVWRDGVKQADRSDFLVVARKLPSSAQRRLIVLQPRITGAEVTRCLAAGAPPTHAIRMKQINTMMLAARSSAINCGASFEGIAAK